MIENTPGQAIRFRLTISTEKYLAYYQGRARSIMVRAEDGRNIKFPASNLRPFLTHDGIFGLFEIRFDGNNKLTDLVRLGS